MALSGTSLVVIFFLTSVGATLFYALGLSMLLIGAHAAMRVPGAQRGWGPSGWGGSCCLAELRTLHCLCWPGSGAFLLACCCSHRLPPSPHDHHPPTRAADDLFLDDVPETQQGGFLSLLTGGAKPVVATAIASAV